MTVDFNPGAEQLQVIAAVREILADRFPLARFRNARGGDHDRDALAEVAALGWFGLGVAGLGVADEVSLFREFGRHLVSPGAVAASLAVHAALALGKADLAAGIVAGSVRVCLANALTENASATHAIFDAAGADHVLFWNFSDFSCVPFDQVTAAQAGRCLDRTVSLLRARIATGSLFSLSGEAARQLSARADLLVAAQLLGLAEAALELAVEHAKLRHQFGQPIGAFQAIKHRCADMKLRVTALSALVNMAALAAQEGLADADLQIAAARLLAARYAVENAAAGIQIHGAMGFAAECDAHLFLLRAHLLENIGGTTAEREAAMAAMPA